MHSASSPIPTRRPANYRPLVERLEDRLPPGDTVAAALFAGMFVPPERMAVPDPAVSIAWSGSARPLATASFELPATLAPATDALPAEVSSRVSRAALEEAFAPASGGAGPLRASPGVGGDTGTTFVPGAPSPPAAVASSGGGAVFVAPPAPNYHLDQAAAAVAPPVADRDVDFGGGGEVQSAAVRALFDLGHPTTGPFPSNVFTVPDRTQNTDLRINLPYPDCAVYVSDCEDIAVLNELDGFNLQPRLSIPFSDPIDVNSVTSDTVFLVSLGSTLPHGSDPRGTVVGINQVVWDVATHTLHVESDTLLAQHTRFALIVTNGIRDADGARVEASPEFRRFRQTAPREYKRELLDAVHEARRLGVRERDIVTASVFTTQSATAVLEKIRDQIKAQTPAPADFLIGTKGERAVFELPDVTGIRWDQQTLVEGPLNPVAIDFSFLEVYPGSVGRLAYGKYTSPNYLTADVFIPAVGTRTGSPAVQSRDDIYFTLFLPSGPAPAAGWPVAVVGHGGSTNKNDWPMRLAASNAVQGLASVFINKVGNGFGPLGTLTVARGGGEPVTFPDGGRGRDTNGNGAIAVGEGSNALAPQAIIGTRDGFRQTAADLMQLVRVIGVGVDVDGDGGRDLDPARVYYFGTSAAGWYGGPFVAVEPEVRAAVFNVTGGTVIDTRHLVPGGRPPFGAALAARVPPLLNGPGVTQLEGVAVGTPRFHDNKPLRDGLPLAVRLADGTDQVIRAPVVNTAAGAAAIQQVLDNAEWVALSGDVLAYAPHLQRAPLAGIPARPVLLQFARGDQTVPNPSTAAVLRAGNLAGRTSLYRHDLAYAEHPELLKNPHTYYPSLDVPTWRDIALGAQGQTATFFASDGKEIIHPEPARFFEVPIKALPEELNYIP